MRTVPLARNDADPVKTTCVSVSIADARAQQRLKIDELNRSLQSAGCRTVGEQAKALGLGRSTAWAILRHGHKTSGLTAATINRMLQAPDLPADARAKILEYVEEKGQGLYGHSKVQIKRFYARIRLDRSSTETSIYRFLPLQRSTSDRAT